MDIIFDLDMLARLLESFSKISNVRYSVLDRGFHVFCGSARRTDFCEAINALPEGHRRCEECDMRAAKNLRSPEHIYTYRCHAGVLESLLPLTENGQVVAYLFLGQMLDSGVDIDTQWNVTRASLMEWFPDPDSLREPFMRLQRFDSARLSACEDILKACASYIKLDGMIRADTSSDTQRLHAYIDANFSMPITLQRMSEDLYMSKTKLCGLAVKENQTITGMINSRRIQAARELLSGSALPIMEISQRVGVPDYNYFTKLFKSLEGMTPRQYRNMARARAGDASEAE